MDDSVYNVDEEKLIEALRNHLISSEQEGDISLLCKWVLEIIKQ